ncbi:adenylosuccinate lyase [Candidatus Peregrinibacteria bacterium CG_4_10_14_0_2_um_filter_38_24]|nr:MAG: adenylosuccinate lyase [Candidatus Peregrinibacteria bacterium CG_4_10_14_0_2_um_filter_38_24]PJC38922.1 MAG: adenylosuccinate lyase [Candidatus Peregrinibacteria bacterium CG_4_9_14_0_2_um_filter_38_9]
MEHSLLAVSPLDGRYSDKVSYLSQYFAEAALMRYRVLVEIEWFIFIFNDLDLAKVKLDSKKIRMLREIYEDFDIDSAKKIKEIERTTNHDVKAVEYFIKGKFEGTDLEKYSEFVHFACTSEDINNLSYSCSMRDFLERDFLVTARDLAKEIYALGSANRAVAMLARTHGQTATPTTLGKEMINFVARLEKELEVLSNFTALPAKINGAVGNYNAHVVAYKNVDWQDAGKKFVESLGLSFNAYTTQIEPHDGFAFVFDSVKRLNTILLDFDRDMWTYISLGYFGQRTIAGEVGSSTMPHKVNPIDFENSEGNLGLANALLSHMSEKLPISRMQRDLTDSTVLRNIGSAFAYSILAYKSTIKGIAKCEIKKDVIKDDLKDRWEVLAEPIQVVMRKNLVKNSYEQLKELTRGKGGISKTIVQSFIKKLKIKAEDKKTLLDLTPEKYVGLATKLVDEYELKSSEGLGGCGDGGCGSCGGGCG